MEISEKNTKKKDQSRCHSDNLSIYTQIYVFQYINTYLNQNIRKKKTTASVCLEETTKVETLKR